MEANSLEACIGEANGGALAGELFGEEGWRRAVRSQPWRHHLLIFQLVLAHKLQCGKLTLCKCQLLYLLCLRYIG